MSVKKIVKKETEFAGKKLVLETGEVAMQANMAVKASYGDTVVLATAVASGPNPDLDYFPLSVGYEEKLYASGLIKSSRFVKRDGRPTDEATVTRRLIDHAIRPLFPSDFMDETQVIVTVLSLDPDSDPEFLSMVAASAALHASDIPWAGPMSTARVGYEDGELSLGVSKEKAENSDLDMIVSFVGEDKKYLALEAQANILPEEKILEAINFARDNIDPIVNLITDFTKEVNPKNEKYEYESFALSEDLLNDIREFAKEDIVEMLSQGFDKSKLTEKQDELTEEIFVKFEGKYKKVDMIRALAEVEKNAMQHLILEEKKRPDGRGIREVREIISKVGVLPRTHGSALFTRGMTQALTVATLGSPSLELLIQDMYGEEAKRYIHYYNFPPYSVGETGRLRGPGGREIGHGMLAEKALVPVIPSQNEFPYTILLMSEILSSSGSSSMASACGSTLALMDAGVPIKDMVGGVGVGLISTDDFSKYVVLTDLAYMEDAFGFLDFKMTGTKDGVTAIQSDMKLQGIPVELLEEIVQQSREGRLKVLEEMEKTIKAPRDSVSEYAPKTETIKIDPEKIGVVIGSGGKTIKELEARTGAVLAIEEDGTIVISSASKDGLDQAKAMVEGLVKEIETGEIYEGEVKEITGYGAFVEVLPGKEGLLHISEIADGYVEKVEDFINVGDKIKVKVIDTSPDGKFSLSIKALTSPDDGGDSEKSGGRGRGRQSGRGRGGRGGRNGRNSRKRRTR